MAPVKPMGARNAPNAPKTKPGVTGFEQEYNQGPGPRQDLNPDAVDDPDSLPEPLPANPDATRASKARKTSRKPRK